MKSSLVKKIDDYIYEIPADAKMGMNVPARIYASESLINDMDEAVFTQITNVATLPGIIYEQILEQDS